MFAMYKLFVLYVGQVVAVICVSSVNCEGAKLVMYRLTQMSIGHVVAVTWVAVVACMDTRFVMFIQSAG